MNIEELVKRAHTSVRRAIESGVLYRPEECETCGCKPGRATDGRARIHAHHNDHSRPLEVVWLCPKCHRKITPLAQGSRSSTAKISEKDALAIFDDPRTSRRIAADYGINQTTVCRIKSGKHWGHVTASQEKSHDVDG